MAVYLQKIFQFTPTKYEAGTGRTDNMQPGEQTLSDIFRSVWILDPRQDAWQASHGKQGFGEHLGGFLKRAWAYFAGASVVFQEFLLQKHASTLGASVAFDHDMRDHSQTATESSEEMIFLH